MKEAYYFRLDDACPTWNREKWMRLAQLLDQHEVKPLVAVVPNNQDEELVQGEFDEHFVENLKHWHKQGWQLGLHGFTHHLRRRPRGLVPRNPYGEWAGDSLSTQRKRMSQAWKLAQDQGWSPQWWVAPAHNFDKTTLHALERETPIRQISDGWSRWPYYRFGFLWLPQQLGRPRRMGSGFWTICLHPNLMTEQDFCDLENWLRKSPPLGIWDEVKTMARSYGLHERLFHVFWSIGHRIKSLKRNKK